MARSGMADLISQLRGRVNATHDDYMIGTAKFWDADQTQAVLDMYRTDINRMLVSPVASYNSGGTVQYQDYPSGVEHLEQTTGGTSIFYLEAGDNTKIGTANYSVDYNRGYITFTADQKGSAYYLTGRSYDLNASAAYIWRMKAARFAESFDYATDNMRVSLSQKMQHALKMAEFYEGRSGQSVNVITIARDDINTSALI